MAPLEREYEAWIVRDIEDYFIDVGILSEVIAVSPKVEKDWPADVESRINGKVFGLQVKRPYVSNPCHWNIGNPPGQLTKVRRSPEIYYALPAFFNRRYRRSALHHTLFWRPANNTGSRYALDYGRVRRSNLMRTWGEFFKDLISCREGIRLSPERPLSAYLETFYSLSWNQSEEMGSDGDDNEDVEPEVTQVFWLDIDGIT